MESLVHSIEFQMSLLLFVSLAGYLLASRINQSAVIGEILVGLIIGPSLFGLITYTDFVASIAHMGAVILLFVVGLEFKIKEIFNIKYGIIGTLGVIVPWLGGFFLSRFFGFGFEGSVFIGTALTATSIAITANVLREMGKLQTEAAKAIIGAAVIDDVLGLVALSFSGQIAGGSFSLVSVILVLIKASLFIVLGLYIGKEFVGHLLEKVDCSRFGKKYPEFVFILAMAIAFFYAMMAELIEMSAIVGSFIAGVAMESAYIRYGKDHRKGAEYLHIIFASVFFVSLGILANFHALTPGIIIFLLVLSAVAIATKIIGCFVPSRLMGMSNKDAIVVGIGMAPRGEVAMIVALIGLNYGLIGQDIYVSLVMMSLLTTVATPLLLRRIFKEKKAEYFFKRKK